MNGENVEVTQTFTYLGSVIHSSTSCVEQKYPMGGILRRESRHMPIEAQLALSNYAGHLSQTSLPEHQVII